MISPTCCHKWLPLLTSWAPGFMRCRRTGVGRRDLQAANQLAKSSSKETHFFRIVVLTESPKIMGLMGICLPKALQQWSGLTFCLWCGKKAEMKGWW